MNRAALLLLACLAAGCTPEASAPSAERGGEAAGEVLGGSISDAMIPLDQLESEAPPAPLERPSATDIEAEQPEVTPMPGINDPVPADGADDGVPAAPAPAAGE
jgi:hypothetical protein